jgi:hypothetical protein
MNQQQDGRFTLPKRSMTGWLLFGLASEGLSMKMQSARSIADYVFEDQRTNSRMIRMFGTPRGIRLPNGTSFTEDYTCKSREIEESPFM